MKDLILEVAKSVVLNREISKKEKSTGTRSYLLIFSSCCLLMLSLQREVGSIKVLKVGEMLKKEAKLVRWHSDYS